MSLTSCIEKIHASEGYITSFYRKFFVSQYGKTSWRNPSVLCFRKFPVAKFMDKRGGGVSTFSVENFLSHSFEKFRRGTVMCFTNFLVSKKFMDRRVGGGREYHDFLSKNFCLTVPKKFVVEPFSVSFIYVSKKLMLQRVLSRVSVENFFVSQYGKTSLGNPLVLCFRKFPVAKFMDKRRGVSRISVENFFSHSF